MVDLEGKLPIINIPPHGASHSQGILGKERCWLLEHTKRVIGYDAIPGHDEPHTLCGSMNALQEGMRTHTNWVDL